MANFSIYLLSQREPLSIEFPFFDANELARAASSARFLVGRLVGPDCDGVCRKILISTSRIQCAIEFD
jgi:hypothetical protein